MRKELQPCGLIKIEDSVTQKIFRFNGVFVCRPRGWMKVSVPETDVVARVFLLRRYCEGSEHVVLVRHQV